MIVCDFTEMELLPGIIGTTTMMLIVQPMYLRLKNTKRKEYTGSLNSVLRQILFPPPLEHDQSPDPGVRISGIKREKPFF